MTVLLTDAGMKMVTVQFDSIEQKKDVYLLAEEKNDWQ